MKKFRIVPTDEIKAAVYHKGQMITYLDDIGFSTIGQVKSQIINKLGWPWKGYGRKIEISILNVTKEQTKYINTFT